MYCTLNIRFSLWGQLVFLCQCKNIHPGAEEATVPPACEGEGCHAKHKQLAARRLCDCQPQPWLIAQSSSAAHNANWIWSPGNRDQRCFVRPLAAHGPSTLR